MCSKVFNTLPGPVEFHFHRLLEILVERRPLLNDDISFSRIRQKGLEYLRKWKHALTGWFSAKCESP